MEIGGSVPAFLGQIRTNWKEAYQASLAYGSRVFEYYHGQGDR